MLPISFESPTDENLHGTEVAMKTGDVIRIRCDVRPGPFSGEHMIAFQTEDGSVSGFVRDSELMQKKFAVVCPRRHSKHQG
jgi:hypothetical protein